MSASGESKRSCASCLTSSVLPTPVGPTKMKLTGLCLGEMPHTVAADGRSDSLDSLVLTDNVLF